MDVSKGWKTSKRPSDTFYEAAGGFVISGGNFHGEYPAKVRSAAAMRTLLDN